MRIIFLLTLLTAFTNTVLSQTPSNETTPGKVFGRVFNAKTKKPIEYVTVVVRHKRDSSFISGGLTDSSGKFLVEGLKPGPYKLNITFLGSGSTDTIFFISPQKWEFGFDSLFLGGNVNLLKGVVVSGDRPDFQLGLDKKVFNVDKNTIAEGGTATDILKQIPTVEVDMDGGISIRGTGNLIVLINGKPSGMTGANRQAVLDQIPANQIERVEIITNPSAKYDADGTSGIINIILKTNIKPGYNGTVSAGVGTNHKYNLGASVSYRSGKWGMNANYGGRYNTHWGEGSSVRNNFISGYAPNTLLQTSESKNINQFHSLSGAVEYRKNEFHSFSINFLAGLNFGKHPEDNYYDFLDSSEQIDSARLRSTKQNRNGFNTDLGFTYIKTYKTPKKELKTTANFSSNSGNRNSEFVQEELDVNHYSRSLPLLKQNNYVADKFSIAMLQLDFTNPLRRGTFETGAKTTLRNLDNNFDADSLNNTTGNLDKDYGLINNFVYQEWVLAGYGIWSGKTKFFEYQTGLRIESTIIEGEQKVTNQKVANNYTNLFPSIFIKKEIDKNREIQAGYSRRINRPGTWSLNPFADYSDPLNIRTGNPNLGPEIIESVEATYFNVIKKVHNISITGYFRQINNTIQRIRYIDTNGISNVTFENLDYARNFGLEFIYRGQVTKWWTLTGNLNIFRNILYGNNQAGELSTNNNSWSVKINSSVRLNKKSMLQTNYSYNGPRVIPQGTFYAIQFLDFGYRYDLNKKFTITLNLSDALNQREMNITANGFNFRSETYRKRESRILTLNMTWKFGDAAYNSMQRKRGRNEDAPSGGDDMGL